jgi:uncharacterized protein YutE (UPF0331/DUF86 family)
MRIESDDVCLNKAAIIERAIGRALEEYSLDPKLESYTHIDAMILNIERACQAAIDLAFHIIATDRLGMPQTSSDAFRLLLKGELIGRDTARDMIAMTGFRNIAVHEYQIMDMSILRAIGEERWRSLVTFCRELGIKIDPKQ